MIDNGSPTTGRPRRPTAADVARRAGLSQTTVSFVLNNSPQHKIPEATRQRVLQAAAELGYAPSAAARALARGRSGVVLCLLRDLPMGPDLGRYLAAVSGHLEGSDLTFVWHPRSHSTRPLADVWRNVTPAAVLTFEPLQPDETAGLLGCGAVVIQGSGDGGGGRETVGMHLGRLQAEHLVERGHRRIGYAYPTDPRLQPIADGRLRGVASVTDSRNLPRPLAQHVDNEAVDGAVAALRAWRAAEVDAVCAYNDEFALALQAAVRREGGPSMPVVGADDLPAARFGDPPLTTIRRDWDVLAVRTADRILAALEGLDAVESPVDYGDRLVVRESA